MKKSKNTINIIIGTSLFIMTNIIFADSNHYHQENTLPYEKRETTTITTLTGQSEGVSSAIAASQHQFYYGTKAWQGSFAAGAFDNNTAFSFGLAKRFQKTLINGSVSVENGKTGYGAALNWQF